MNEVEDKMITFLLSQQFLSIVTLLTLLVALGALVLTYREVQRNNKSIIRVIDCSMSYGSSVYDPRFKATFLVRVKNLGITLYNPQISLRITSSKELGQMNLGLQRQENKTGQIDQFAKGMIAEFVWERYDDAIPDEADKYFREEIAQHLANPKHRIDLVICSQTFEADILRMNGYKARILRIYNNWVQYLSTKWYCFTQKKKKDEIDLAKYFSSKYYSYAERFLIEDFLGRIEHFLEFYVKPPRDSNAPSAI